MTQRRSRSWQRWGSLVDRLRSARQAGPAENGLRWVVVAVRRGQVWIASTLVAASMGAVAVVDSVEPETTGAHKASTRASGGPTPSAACAHCPGDSGVPDLSVLWVAAGPPTADLAPPPPTDRAVGEAPRTAEPARNRRSRPEPPRSRFTAVDRVWSVKSGSDRRDHRPPAMFRLALNLD